MFSLHYCVWNCFSQNENCEYIVLGDLNSRVGLLNDFVHDDFLHNLNIMPDDYVEDEFLPRLSQDQSSVNLCEPIFRRKLNVSNQFKGSKINDWFDIECKTKRKEFYGHLNNYRQNNSPENRRILTSTISTLLENY